MTDRIGNAVTEFSSCFGTAAGVSPIFVIFWSLECLVGEGSPAKVDPSSSFRKLTVLDLGVPKRNGDIVLGRARRRGGDGTASEIYQSSFSQSCFDSDSLIKGL